ncbi:SH3 domain-containing protein [Algoriphagus sp.]|uniref:SH3 domain-containing protein n=1 Tax=Algoriphagus sp. TaxID=1872435 RepID=UPI0026270CE4|nr:SH3 domain-containing protein [Algoriphagus sp.]
MPKENFSEWPLSDGYGICRQTILPVYKKPTVESALLTQLLFGECYQVLAVCSDRSWYRIFQEDSRIGGWISAKSLKEITQEDYQHYLNEDFQVVISPISAIEYNGTQLYLLPGSRLHFSDLELFNWQDHIGFTGQTRSHAHRAKRDELIQIAMTFINAPWQSGGRSIFGLDHLLGFALIFQIAGYAWHAGHLPGRLIRFADCQPGDILICPQSGEQKNRLAIYLGMEEVLQMDDRMRRLDLDEWLRKMTNNRNKQEVLEVRTVF